MNKLREKLKNNIIALGSHISLNDSTVTEIMGDVGFDYLWIDTEHTPISLDCLQNHLVAARASGVSAIVRVPEVSQVKAKPILEMGPDGIVFPQVNSYELALEAVAACKYPPVGNRGWGPRRAMHFGVDMSAQDYIAHANDDILTILQFENINAYKDLDRILSIDGLDVILLGPCDLAASMGHIGDWHHPDVERIVDDAVNASQICHHRAHHAARQSAAEQERGHVLVAWIDEVAEPVVDELLRQRTSLHICVHIQVSHLEALVLQHRLHGDDVRMHLTPRQRFDGGVNHVGTVVTHLEDRSHRQAWARVTVILHDDVRVLCLDGLRQGTEHSGLSDTGHILQTDFLRTCGDHLLSNP